MNTTTTTTAAPTFQLTPPEVITPVQPVQAVEAVVGHLDTESLGAQAAGQRSGQPDLVLHQQHSHGVQCRRSNLAIH